MIGVARSIHHCFSQPPIMFSQPHESARYHSNRVCQFGLALLWLASALRRECGKLSLTLLELASSLCCGLREQPIMFLEPRDVGRPEKPVPAQEGYICYESSYQPAHSAIRRGPCTISCHQNNLNASEVRAKDA